MLRILVFFLLFVQFIYPQKKAIKSDIIKQDFFLDKSKFEEDQNIKIEKETNFYFKTGANRSEYDFFMSDGLKEKSLIPQYQYIQPDQKKEERIVKSIKKIDTNMKEKIKHYNLHSLLEINTLNDKWLMTRNYFNINIGYKTFVAIIKK